MVHSIYFLVILYRWINKMYHTVPDLAFLEKQSGLVDPQFSIIKLISLYYLYCTYLTSKPIEQRPAMRFRPPVF